MNTIGRAAETLIAAIHAETTARRTALLNGTQPREYQLVAAPRIAALRAFERACKQCGDATLVKTLRRNVMTAAAASDATVADLLARGGLRPMTLR